jgi:hypothetical protein
LDFWSAISAFETMTDLLLCDDLHDFLQAFKCHSGCQFNQFSTSCGFLKSFVSSASWLSSPYDDDQDYYELDGTLGAPEFFC